MFTLVQSEMTDWQGDGSNTGFSQVNFESAEGSSQQNAPGVSIPIFFVVAFCFMHQE